MPLAAIILILVLGGRIGSGVARRGEGEGGLLVAGEKGGVVGDEDPGLVDFLAEGEDKASYRGVEVCGALDAVGGEKGVAVAALNAGTYLPGVDVFIGLGGMEVCARGPVAVEPSMIFLVPLALPIAVEGVTTRGDTDVFMDESESESAVV